MDKRDIALELTLKAIDAHYLHVDRISYSSQDDIEAANKNNVKEVVDFYNYILTNINS